MRVASPPTAINESHLNAIRKPVIQDLVDSVLNLVHFRYLELLRSDERLVDELGAFGVERRDRKYQFWKSRTLDVRIITYRVFAQKIQYIHLNPVKAGLVDQPSEYKFSSALSYKSGNSRWRFLTLYV